MGYKQTIKLLMKIEESPNFKELEKELQEDIKKELDKWAKNRESVI